MRGIVFGAMGTGRGELGVAGRSNRDLGILLPVKTDARRKLASRDGLQERDCAGASLGNSADR